MGGLSSGGRLVWRQGDDPINSRKRIGSGTSHEEKQNENRIKESVSGQSVSQELAIQALYKRSVRKAWQSLRAKAPS